MSSETKRYMALIGEHLQEHHASVLVGAGFSRNAVKIDDTLPDTPTWEELGEAFVKKLSDDPDEQKHLRKLSPLVLAERIESLYGRPELDCLLMSSIRDADFLPSSLHRKLLELPWTDIFTTNYDTLLERTAEEMTEKKFSVITCKEDLVGSSGITRIVKLHGSFPSHRPFIISSEDYRTYPQTFAPFVNTVQQAMLENTVCLIGFSGDDPNFEKWIGWIRDNLGSENTPNIYLLLHYAPSEAEKKLLSRRKIIPIDLSQLCPNTTNATEIYETALDYLLELQKEIVPDKWELNHSFYGKKGGLLPLEDALKLLQQIHGTYPGWLTVPDGQRSTLCILCHQARNVLAAHCAHKDPTTDIELEYLYEYDWLREKALLPFYASETTWYWQVLNRHPENSSRKYAIQLSLLRDLRESGEWDKWNAEYDILKSAMPSLLPEQSHQLQWEGCLCALAQFQFQDLSRRLDAWSVEPSKSVWVLRKAGLLAEYGRREDAQAILEPAILDVRRRLAHQRGINLSLLSLESAMMSLQQYLAHSLNHKRISDSVGEIDRSHRALHDQYHVNWELQNEAFQTRLEAPWQPFHQNHKEASFDFGGESLSTDFGEDEEAIYAYAFLRFREESGVPFFLNHVANGVKAACGAAERIARYWPLLSVLTIVRADESKAVEKAITRGLLSSWTQKTADELGCFYRDALLRAEIELVSGDWPYRKSFASLAAAVLPSVLSLICVKCSLPCLKSLASLVSNLYTSQKKQWFSEMQRLTQRLALAYPAKQRRDLALQFLVVPLAQNVREQIDFPDPLSLVPFPRNGAEQTAKKNVPEIEALFSQYQDAEASERTQIQNRLLHCLFLGLLTLRQKRTLRDYFWVQEQFYTPRGWLQTICLRLPAPNGIDVPRYLAQVLAANIGSYSGNGVRIPHDGAFLAEIKNLVQNCPGCFSAEQITSLLDGFHDRIRSLLGNLNQERDILGLKLTSLDQLYEIAQTLWLLTEVGGSWEPSDENLQQMREILDAYERNNIRHCGLYCAWKQRLGEVSDIASEFSTSFRSPDESRASWAYQALAKGIHYPSPGLIEDAAIQSALDVLAQQIVWAVPRLLPFALQAVSLAVIYRPELLSPNALDAVLTGIGQIEQQTVICADDTAKAASTKGDVRRWAAALADKLYKANLHGNHLEILKRWQKILHDKNEFAEIRNAALDADM